MQIKCIEIRDRMTFVPAIAMRFTGAQSWLLRRAGFAVDMDYVILIPLNRNNYCYDAWQWNDRTFHNVHKELGENWDKYESGSLIDVEFLLGETSEPKTSERLLGVL